MHLGIDCNLVSSLAGLSVMAGGSLAPQRPSGFSTTRRFGGRATTSSAVDVHPPIPHAYVNGVTPVLRSLF